MKQSLTIDIDSINHSSQIYQIDVSKGLVRILRLDSLYLAFGSMILHPPVNIVTIVLFIHIRPEQYMYQRILALTNLL